MRNLLLAGIAKLQQSSRQSLVAAAAVAELSALADAPRAYAGAAGTARGAVAADAAERVFRRHGSEAALGKGGQANDGAGIMLLLLWVSG